MIKLKYLYPILFVLFVGLSNTNLAQVSDKKPSLKEKLEEVFAEAKQKEVTKKEKSKTAKVIVEDEKLIAESKSNTSSQQNKDSKSKKTTLKSRKAKSSLMDALREAMNN